MVSSITESDPWSGSVRPQAPIFSILAISGSHLCFCSSEPQMATVPMASPEWTPKNVFKLPSPRAISMAHSPAATWLMPGQPYSSMVAPAMFSSATLGTSSNGNSALSQYSLMMGMTSASAKALTRSRISRSSSVYNSSSR